MNTAPLPRIGSVIEHNGSMYRVTRHATHNLDTLGRLVMGRRILNINTMEEAKRSTRIYL